MSADIVISAVGRITDILDNGVASSSRGLGGTWKSLFCAEVALSESASIILRGHHPRAERRRPKTPLSDLLLTWRDDRLRWSAMQEVESSKHRHGMSQERPMLVVHCGRTRGLGVSVPRPKSCRCPRPRSPSEPHRRHRCARARPSCGLVVSEPGVLFGSHTSTRISLCIFGKFNSVRSRGKHDSCFIYFPFAFPLFNVAPSLACVGSRCFARDCSIIHQIELFFT